MTALFCMLCLTGRWSSFALAYILYFTARDGLPATNGLATPLLLQHARPLPDRQPGARATLDCGGEYLLCPSEIASITQAVDLRAVARRLLDLVEVAIVGEEQMSVSSSDQPFIAVFAEFTQSVRSSRYSVQGFERDAALALCSYSTSIV